MHFTNASTNQDKVNYLKELIRQENLELTPRQVFPWIMQYATYCLGNSSSNDIKGGQPN